MKKNYVKPTIKISFDNYELLQAAGSIIAGDKTIKILRSREEKEVSSNSKNK